METKVCTRCGVEKDIKEFPLRSRFTKLRQSYCKDCRKVYGAEWYENHKEYQKENSRKHTTVYRESIREYLWNYLLTHPCENCGESDPVVLEFHHIGEKDMAVSQMVTNIINIERLKEELRKCQVLCSNCHRRVTAQERGWYRSRK
jgi:hypothetical protein